MESLPEPPSPVLETHLIAEENTGDRMAAGVMRFRLSRPQVLIGWPLIVVAVVTFGITQDALIPVLIFLVLIFPVLTWVLYRQTRRTMRNFFAPGSVHATSFGSESMTITGPFGSSDIRYRLFKQIWLGSTVVVLRQRPTKIITVLPAELVPAEAMPLIRAGILTPQ